MATSTKQKSEKQLMQQYLNEQGKTGYMYGTPEPIVKQTKSKGREVIINGYTLVSAILDTPNIKNKDYIKIPLGKDKELAIDLVTREVLYFDYNDDTYEESYLDNVSFYEE